jgi:hypothetical protein
LVNVVASCHLFGAFACQQKDRREGQKKGKDQKKKRGVTMMKIGSSSCVCVLHFNNEKYKRTPKLHVEQTHIGI